MDLQIGDVDEDAARSCSLARADGLRRGKRDGRGSFNHSSQPLSGLSSKSKKTDWTTEVERLKVLNCYGVTEGRRVYQV